MAKKFIQHAIKRKGALRKKLEIPHNELIPVPLLEAIVKSKSGQTITNPTSIGKKRIKITARLEHEANLALTLRRFRK